MQYPTIGIDSAKDVFHLILGDSAGRPVKKVKLKRNKLAAFMANQPVSKVFMESCAGSHHRARKGTRLLVAEEFERWKGLAERVEVLKGRIERGNRTDAKMKRLQKELEGVGPLSAAELWTAVADPKAFAQGRQFAAFAGLVSRQHTTGDRSRLLGIRKGGRNELRALLIHGARAAIRHLGDKTDPKSMWLRALD